MAAAVRPRRIARDAGALTATVYHEEHEGHQGHEVKLLSTVFFVCFVLFVTS
jgi:hypothetical protein